MPTFTNEKDRHNWIVKHANYFTVVRFHGGGVYERYEVPRLETAKHLAQTLNLDRLGRPWMIYACTDHMDTFVEAVK